MTNFSEDFSSKLNLENSAQALLSLAENIQAYRITKSSELTGDELKSLDDKESEVRDKAQKISAKKIDDILESKLKPTLDGLKQSIAKTRQALKNLKGIGDVIAGLTQALELANDVLKMII